MRNSLSKKNRLIFPPTFCPIFTHNRQKMCNFQMSFLCFSSIQYPYLFIGWWKEKNERERELKAEEYELKNSTVIHYNQLSHSTFHFHFMQYSAQNWYHIIIHRLYSLLSNRLNHSTELKWKWIVLGQSL